MSMNLNFRALVALAALGAAAGAHAAPVKPFDDGNLVAVKVNYADLDLAGEAGAKVMIQRIHNAAREICGDQPDSRMWADARSHRSCIDSTVDRAVVKLGSPMVAMLYGHSQPVEFASKSR